jgi:membrane-associated phospholipid phosphatase
VMMIVMITGMFLPIFLPIILFILGWILKKTKLTITAAIIWQSAILGWFISSTYKAFTGRVHPDYGNTIVDISHNFNFGFWENGIFWGWPSSHTTTSFAIAMALVFAFSGNKIIRLLAPLYAMCIWLGTTIGAHWFSEFFAGALIGTAVGIVVGKSFRELLK